MWKDKEKHEETAEEDKDENTGAIEQLEKRVEESRKEMEEIDRLEEIKELNSRHVTMTSEEILGKARGEGGLDVDAIKGEMEDEEAVKNVVFGIWRLEDEDSDNEDVGKIVKESFAGEDGSGGGGGGVGGSGGGGEKRKPPVVNVVVKKKKKRKVEKKMAEKKVVVEKKDEQREGGERGLGGLLGGYGSDSS